MPCPRCHLERLFHVPRDVDYVHTVQVLNRLELEIRRHGPSLERLLRKVQLERDAGNYLASHAAAVDAHVLDPRNPELHYQVGLALAYLALCKVQLAPWTPATRIPDQDAGELLEEAAAALRSCLELNPADQDAHDLLAGVGDLQLDVDHVQHVHVGQALA